MSSHKGSASIAPIPSVIVLKTNMAIPAKMGPKINHIIPEPTLPFIKCAKPQSPNMPAINPTTNAVWLRPALTAPLVPTTLALDTTFVLYTFTVGASLSGPLYSCSGLRLSFFSLTPAIAISQTVAPCTYSRLCYPSIIILSSFSRRYVLRLAANHGTHFRLAAFSARRPTESSRR